MLSVEEQVYVVAGVLGGTLAGVLVTLAVLAVRQRTLARRLHELDSQGKFKIQRAKIHDESIYSYANPTITPDEELARRGYSMYVGNENERNPEGSQGRISGPFFIEDIERQPKTRQPEPPPFVRSQSFESQKHLRNALAIAHEKPQPKNQKNKQNASNFIY